MIAARVAVVGSTNLDQSVRVRRRPDDGATVLGYDYREGCGGKGANQALASAAAGASTTLVTSLGADGQALAGQLRAVGVDVHAHVATGPTGRAIITISDDAENTIVVVPGANAALRPDTAVAVLDRIRPTVVLAQLEIDASVVVEVAAWSARSGSRFVLNASPVETAVPTLLAAADPLIVNVGEARALLSAHGPGNPPLDAAVGEATWPSSSSGTTDSPAGLAAGLLGLCRSVVVTAGADGACYADPVGRGSVPAISVAAVDTTGAGDALAGTIAAHLAAGETLDAAVRAGVAAGAEATLHLGANRLAATSAR